MYIPLKHNSRLFLEETEISSSVPICAYKDAITQTTYYGYKFLVATALLL